MKLNIRRRLTLLLQAIVLVVSGLVFTYAAGIEKPIVAEATNPPAAGWATVNSYNSSSSQDNHLTSVTCLTATNCMAAGNYLGTKNQTLIETYNGSSWSNGSGVNAGSGQSNFLNGITCVASNDCWAVGYYCTTTGTCPHDNGPYWQTLIEHYNGTSWSVTTSPNQSTTQDNILNGVTCASSSLCWAVGQYCERTDKRQCTQGASNSWQPLIEKWDGTSWTRVIEATNSTSKNHDLTSVYCSSTSDCWAVGYYCNTTGTCPAAGVAYQTLIEHWTGSTWSIVTSANTGSTLENELNGVTCSSTSVCWAVGYACGSNNCSG
jgi:hypothetical protein